MRNPWLDIPDVDYVGHMSSPAVSQRAVLSRLMGEALESVRPRTMLVLIDQRRARPARPIAAAA